MGVFKLLKSNLNIRKKIKESGLPFWFIADQLGVADTTFSKWLRKELPEEKKQMILEIIKQETKESSENG